MLEWNLDPPERLRDHLPSVLPQGRGVFSCGVADGAVGQVVSAENDPRVRSLPYRAHHLAVPILLDGHLAVHRHRVVRAEEIVADLFRI